VFLLVTFFIWWFIRGANAATWQTVRSWLVPLGVIAVGFLIEAGVEYWAATRSRWRWDLALFPAVLVAIQGFNVYRVRRFAGVVNDQVPLRPNLEREDPMVVAEVVKQLHNATEHHFGALPLSLRFGVPAFFIWSFGIGMSNALLREINVYIPDTNAPQVLIVRNDTPESAYDLPWPPQVLIGAAYGLVGAYLFVVLTLGYRSLRQDITPGSATWCAATLAVGPIVSAALAVFWPPPWPMHADNDPGRVALCLMAGFSPRFAVALFEKVAKRLDPASVAGGVAARAIALNQVRGIDDEIANRLTEEGITNATSMARANPIRLIRNTRFDRRQILGWIDCALLMDTLPEHWSALERVGITSATALYWYAPSRGAVGEERGRALAELAAAAGIDAKVVCAASERLVRDPQARIVLVLNELEDDERHDDAGLEHRSV
jgi:hypothetical protein